MPLGTPARVCIRAPVCLRSARFYSQPVATLSSQPTPRRSEHAVCSSSAAAAQFIPSGAEPLPRQQGDVFEALRRCRMLFTCLTFVAVYGFLSSGAVSSLPFASATLAAGETGTHGESWIVPSARCREPHTQQPAKSRWSWPVVAIAGITSAAKSAWAGLAAGFLHTLAGPDHLAVSRRVGCELASLVIQRGLGSSHALACMQLAFLRVRAPEQACTLAARRAWHGGQRACMHTATVPGPTSL